MKNRETGKLHGIVRLIEPYNGVFESTFKNGRNHGLSRAVFDDQVSIVLFKDGVELARFHFDKDFTETGRHDPHGFLFNYDPLFFKTEYKGPRPKHHCHAKSHRMPKIEADMGGMHHY